MQQRSQENRTKVKTIMYQYRTAILFFLSLFGSFDGIWGSSWIDPDTSHDDYTIKPLTKDDRRQYSLIFSDEFNIDGRSFHDGMDPRWTALHKNDVTNNPLHYSSHDAVQTQNGSLRITLSLYPQDDLETMIQGQTESKEFQSGMMQSWDKFCFTGGIVEITAKLPGEWLIGGMWPAIWMMGNLGRATYVNSTENIWPFSTNVCDERTEYSQSTYQFMSK